MSRLEEITWYWTAAMMAGWNIQDPEHARADIPWLIARVRELEGAMREMLDQHRDACGACDDAEALLEGALAGGRRSG